MDCKNDSEQDPFLHNYDDDHDSDVESRLYAEIHFSNTIIGDKNNVTATSTNSQPPDGPIINLNKAGHSNSCLPSIKELDQHVQTQSSNVNNISNNDIERLPNMSSIVVQDESTRKKTNNTPKSQKRPATKDCEPSKANKKRNKISDSNKECNSQINANNIINPYNKNVRNAPQSGIKFLSPEFINLLFGNVETKKKLQKSTAKKKGKQTNNEIQCSAAQSSNQNELVQGNTSKDVIEGSIEKDNATKKVIDNEITHSNVVNQVNEKEVQQNSLIDSSAIIDISSESSKDSIDNDSKYNMTVATDKKLKKKQSRFEDTDSENSESDDAESIFEVPVSPKPAPPLIELKDSGSEKDSDSESDNNSSSSDSFILQANIPQNKSGKSLNTTINTTDNVCYIDTENDESNNLILNCTEIQKGASSLSEIKRMSHQLTNAEESTKEINSIVQNNTVEKNNSHNDNTCNVEKTQSQQKGTSNLVTKKKSVSNKTVESTLNNQQKSSTCSTKKNIPIEEYFFKPMTDRMKSFYNESWGGENFDMDILKSKMSSDPNKWAILDDDLVASFAKRRRYFGMVCSRCQKDGHKQNQCTEAYKVPTCHMCGVAGHLEHSCPHKKCLTCGKRQNMFRKTCEQCERMFCSRCKSRGHMEYSCPDLWRRYHQTINKANVQIPRNLKNVMKSKYEQYCCNCAKKGHISETCKKLRWSLHFPNPEHVINYNGPDYFQDSSRSMDDTMESSFNRSTTNDSLFNLDSTHNISINLNSTFEISPRRQNFSTNTMTDPRKKIIFKIKPKLSVINLKESVLKLNLPDKNGSNNYESWNGLSNFLSILVSNTPAEFSLEQNNGQIQMYIKCVRKYMEILTKLIKQYASRNNFERSHMLMSWERKVRKIAAHVTEQLSELNNLEEDPLQLYEETRQLSMEVLNKENRVINDHQNSLKVNQLAICQRKLLMLLYREGLVDESLKKLKKIHSNFLVNNKYTKGNKFIPMQCLFKYLYYYNNIFVSHEPKNLAAMIRKYKEHVSRCNRLRDNPLLFPQTKNGLINNKSNKIITAAESPEDCSTRLASTSSIPSLLSINTSASKFSNTITAAESSEVCTTRLASRSNVPSLLSVNTSASSADSIQESVCDVIDSIPQNNITCSTPMKSNDKQFQKSTEHLDHEKLNQLKRHPNGLYLESLTCRGKKRKTMLTKKFNSFIQETRKLIAKARELNIPHLRKHIDILQKKMQNEIYVYKTDVKLLKKHVDDELRRRGGNGR